MSGNGAAPPKRRGRFLRLALLVTLAAACYPVAPTLFIVAAAFFLAVPFAAGDVHFPHASASRSSRRWRRWSCSSRGRSVRDGTASTATPRPRLRVPPRPRPRRRPALPLRPVGCRMGDVGAPRRRRGPALRRHRATPRLVSTRLDPRGRRLGHRVGPRTGRARAGRARARKRASPSPRSASRSRSASACRCSSTASARSGSAGGSPRRSSVVSRSCLPILAFTADAADGRWHAPRTGWVDSLAFTGELTSKGQFRTLWWASRPCSRSIPSCCRTAPATRSPATAPGTRRSCSARRRKTPTT